MNHSFVNVYIKKRIRKFIIAQIKKVRNFLIYQGFMALKPPFIGFKMQVLLFYYFAQN